jgi:hypothetical protein
MELVDEKYLEIKIGLWNWMMKCLDNKWIVKRDNKMFRHLRLL